jgi:hypothetical protein
VILRAVCPNFVSDKQVHDNLNISTRFTYQIDMQENHPIEFGRHVEEYFFGIAPSMRSFRLNRYKKSALHIIQKIEAGDEFRPVNLTHACLTEDELRVSGFKWNKSNKKMK